MRPTKCDEQIFIPAGKSETGRGTPRWQKWDRHFKTAARICSPLIFKSQQKSNVENRLKHGNSSRSLQVLIRWLMSPVCLAAPFTFWVGSRGEIDRPMFPETHMQVLAADKWAPCAGWRRACWQMSQVLRGVLLSPTVRSAFPRLPRTAMERLCQWKNGKKCSRPLCDGWSVGWKSPDRSEKSLMCSIYWSCLCDITFKPALKMKHRQWLRANEGKKWKHAFKSIQHVPDVTDLSN